MSTLPLWDELGDLADKLAVAGSVSMPDLRTIRAAAVQMGNWFEANQEYREQIQQLQADSLKYRAALVSIKESLRIVAAHANSEAFELMPDDFARDFAPFRNIMAFHKIEPYHKPKRKSKPKEAA